MMGKYDRLRDWLMDRKEPVTVPFVEIADLTGGLPSSAYIRSEWWSNNDDRHVQAIAWLSAGMRVASLDLGTRTVTFRPNEVKQDEARSRPPLRGNCFLFTDANSRGAHMIGGHIARAAGKRNPVLVPVEGGSFGRPTDRREIDDMEYEALIEGLKLARDLGIEHIWAYTDRRSIVEQFYKCRQHEDDRLKNLNTVKEMRKSFKGFGISYIPRALNIQADLLARPSN
jgi:ribonuclease HI